MKMDLLPRTKKEWMECLRMLINDSKLRSEMGKKGRKHIVDGYSLESQANNFLDLFTSK